jgi:hypothetical protein
MPLTTIYLIGAVITALVLLIYISYKLYVVYHNSSLLFYGLIYLTFWTFLLYVMFWFLIVAASIFGYVYGMPGRIVKNIEKQKAIFNK